MIINSLFLICIENIKINYIELDLIKVWDTINNVSFIISAYYNIMIIIFIYVPFLIIFVPYSLGNTVCQLLPLGSPMSIYFYKSGMTNFVIKNFNFKKLKFSISCQCNNKVYTLMWNLYFIKRILKSAKKLIFK